jgi:hypothetical protein
MIRITIEKLVIEYETPQTVEPSSEFQTFNVEVDTIDFNLTNTFWKERVGMTGTVVAQRGGMWDVQFPCDPFPCQDVDPARFKKITT